MRRAIDTADRAETKRFSLRHGLGVAASSFTVRNPGLACWPAQTDSFSHGFG